MFLVAGILLSIFLNPVFLAVIPITVVSTVYFSMMRYDDDGNQIHR